MLQGDPGPVGDQVEDALLGGLQQRRQHVVGYVPPRTLLGGVAGESRPRERGSTGRALPGGTRASAYRRSIVAFTEGRRHTGSPPPGAVPAASLATPPHT